MYHVSNNARTKKTAQLICDALGKCLEEKPLDKIRVNDIHEKCYVSRATFYRLFDSITDVLKYESDTIFLDRFSLVKDKHFENKEELVVFCANIWLSHPTFVKSLLDNHLIWILQNTYITHYDLLTKLYNIPFENELKIEYFVSILAAILSAVIETYFKNGASEPIEEIYKIVCHSLSTIEKSFINPNF